MRLYRVVKNKSRATDLSGTGAFRAGGRWNSKGTYMLYTSENSSLAYLESLVHFDRSLMPAHLYIIELELEDAVNILEYPYSNYPKAWLKTGLIANQFLGDRWMAEQKYMAIKIKSAINTSENNYLLNPLFPRYHDLLDVISITTVLVDPRL